MVTAGRQKKPPAATDGKARAFAKEMEVNMSIPDTGQFDNNLLAQFDAFTDHLHRGGQWRLFWTPDGQTANGNESVWIPADKPMRLPEQLRRRNMYFSVNPTATAPPEKQRRYRASLNKPNKKASWAVCAVNGLYAEVDAKDFIEEHEWHAYYVQPDVTGMSNAKIRGALSAAQTAAIDAAYAQDPDEYMARAELHIEQLPVAPSVIVFSGGGYHCYWLLADTVHINEQNRDTVAHYQREWVHYVGGDRGATDQRRVLRVPGSQNRKSKYAPNYPLVDFVKFDLDLQYEYEDLIAHLPAAAQRTKTPRPDTYIPKDLRDCIEPLGDVPNIPQTPGVRTFNRENDLRTMLLDLGYTEEDSGRLSRPGANTGGVELHEDNTATIYSLSDPLYCERRVRPVDVLCIYEHAGAVDKTLAHLDRLYAERIQQLDAYLQWLQTPGAIDDLKEAGFKNPARARKLLDVLVERCRQDNSITCAPGYDYLSKRSGISRGGAGCLPGASILCRHDRHTAAT